jgi:hypothetical protein
LTCVCIPQDTVAMWFSMLIIRGMRVVLAPEPPVAGVLPWLIHEPLVVGGLISSEQ